MSHDGIKGEALTCLKTVYGENAEFREGQWEAINAVLARQRTLVVQKTGWGKSLVYFMATKLLRMRGRGPTLLVSPLLALMRNQIDAAEKFDVNAKVINSENSSDWLEIMRDFEDGRVDLLMISPERLGNPEFSKILRNTEQSIGMFVVDEAHCISDWGQDFRPDYRRIVGLVRHLAPNVPVLATTATANDRVVDDIREQLGEQLHVIRGPLTRDTLIIQVVDLPSQAARLAWLADNVPALSGSGIIYCLTTADCRRVVDWLQQRDIDAEQYHARLGSGLEANRLRREREQQLMDNEVKVLVATIALGMGFDKSDLGFVIHYQTPANLMNYYQQIGRAGRNQSLAHAVLLAGQEDGGIVQSMIDSAFPSIEKMHEVVEVLQAQESGLTLNALLHQVNQSQGMVQKCLQHLELDRAVAKEYDDGPTRYIRTANPWTPDVERMRRVTKQRYQEWQRMQAYLQTGDCYMEFIARELNDAEAHPCGKCANCQNNAILPMGVRHDLVAEAARFLRGDSIPIRSKRQWPAGLMDERRHNIPTAEQNQPGRALCLYYDQGYGDLVRQGKYQDHRFSNDLVLAMADLVCRTWPHALPTWVTCVPSRREPQLVPDFSRRVADALGIPFRSVLSKTTETAPQKAMENSVHKAANVFAAFEVTEPVLPGPVLLIDDIVDSGWTFTACGVQLAQRGGGPSIP